MYLQKCDPRTREFFGFNWHFKLAEESSDTTGSGLSGYRAVQLPHDWSVEYPFDKDAVSLGSGGYVKTGVGWYKKHFTVSPESKGKHITLQFDGSYMCTRVTLNGHTLGEHIYGYTPFEYDITNILSYDGENELVVRVDNSQQPNSRWYTGSGITRDVWLCATNTVHIQTYGTYITTKQSQREATINIATTVTGPISECTLVTSIVDADSNNKQSPYAYSETPISTHGSVNQAITLPNPKLWSHNNPNLYKAISVIKLGETILDEYETIFGIRSVVFCPDRGCLINGEQVKLNGVCLHHDGGAVGAAVPKKLWKRRLVLLKEMGANAIRMAHNPPDPSLLELCDEMGFYVMDEAFDEWAQLKWKTAGSNTHESRGYSEWFHEHHVADLEAMLYRDRNHASVIMWSIGNEVPEQALPDGHLLAQKLKDICYKIDPSRLCTQGNDQICAEPRPATADFLNTLDIVGYNYTNRWRTRAETLYDDDKRANPNWLILGTENPSTAGVRGDYRMDLSPNPWRRPYYSAPTNVGRLLRYTMTHDYVIGDFMWTGIDHLGEAHWPNRSSNSGVIDTCGFVKDHYYLYQSIWRDEPMIHLFPHRNLVDVRAGDVLPVLCYTNCTYAELFVNGKSYGRKAYSYPSYGMTETYGHFDTPMISANTDDLFLSWDVPYAEGTMEAVGYNAAGEEISRSIIKTATQPVAIVAATDTNTLQAGGRDIAHIEITFADINGILNPVASNKVTVAVEGAAELIGLDNGNSASHESFKGHSMTAHNGMLLIVIRAKHDAGKAKVTITADGLTPAVVDFTVV
ncbi:MAG: DUF4982 domain-containing protein [Defluviitaleaceae bacterium]|nr:DUF4982 domain-containing protein [Defluviitaleaceae bacterium]